MIVLLLNNLINHTHQSVHWDPVAILPPFFSMSVLLQLIWGSVPRMVIQPIITILVEYSCSRLFEHQASRSHGLIHMAY